MKKIMLSVETGLLDYLMILSVPFCPYHFVPNHFVLEPFKHKDKIVCQKHDLQQEFIRGWGREIIFREK